MCEKVRAHFASRSESRQNIFESYHGSKSVQGVASYFLASHTFPCSILFLIPKGDALSRHAHKVNADQLVMPRIKTSASRCAALHRLMGITPVAVRGRVSA